MHIPKIHTLALSLLLPACATQVQPKETIRDLEPHPVTVADDSVNKLAESQIDGLVLAVTIDGAAIQLDNVTLTKLPRNASQRGAGAGDRVTVVGFAAGARVSESSAPDTVLNVQEDVGVVRLTKRQVVLSLPAPRAVDTVEVSAPATGATARIDVRSAYAPYCKEYRSDNKFCPSPSNAQESR